MENKRIDDHQFGHPLPTSAGDAVPRYQRENLYRRSATGYALYRVPARAHQVNMLALLWGQDRPRAMAADFVEGSRECLTCKYVVEGRSARAAKYKMEQRPEFIDQWPGRPVIRFYETNKPYGCFSNFAAYAVEIDGIIWPTSEHFFQAMKFANPGYQGAIRNTPKAFEAARLGRHRSQPMRADWIEARDGIMRKALKAKFEQHDDLRTVLLSTNGALIVEHTFNDRYWGDGGDGSGRNRLGELLMEVRDNYPDDGYPEFRVPHWLRYPKIDRTDMFWRMGEGEDIAGDFWEFYGSLPSVAREEFDRYFPGMKDWRQ